MFSNSKSNEALVYSSLSQLAWISPIDLLQQGDEFINFSLNQNCFLRQRRSCLPNTVLGKVLVNARSYVCWGGVGGGGSTPPDQLSVIPKAGKSFPWVDASHQRLQEMRKWSQAAPAGRGHRQQGWLAAMH